MKPNPPFLLLWLLIASVFLSSSAGAATSARQLQLGDALQAALERQPVTTEPPPFGTSTWLAALPSLDISYLGSDEQLGTDETELGLNLPLKSPYLRARDRQLRELSGALHDAESDRRRLYYSGLIREAAWTARIAQERAELEEHRLALLQQLLQREQALLDARGSSRYSLLLVRQELVDARLELEDQHALHHHWLARFRQLTGLATLPAALEESPAPPDSPWTQHPALLQLDLTWEQQRALIAAGSERAAPWNLRLGAKQLDAAGFEENQYGLSLEVPLSFLDGGGQSSRSAWQEAAREYWRARDELQLALERRWQELQLEGEHLRRRQQLLEEASGISAELGEQAATLLHLNELGRERWLQRQIDDLDRQAEVGINRLLIQQNQAMSRQAAGIPL